MPNADLARVAGVPETLLSAGLLASLPESAPAAPWICSGTALLWLARGGSRARAALPPVLRGPALAVVGGFVHYSDTPVGGYDEVFGIVASRTGASLWGHVAFMAVDSRASLVGGRTSWGMPKTLATFPRSRVAALGVDRHWEVAARARALGPRLPLRLSAAARQVLPDGTAGASRLVAHARARPALLHMTVTSAVAGPLVPSLPQWLRPGRHLGLLLDDLHLTLSPPSPLQP